MVEIIGIALIMTKFEKGHDPWSMNLKSVGNNFHEVKPAFKFLIKMGIID